MLSLCCLQSVTKKWLLLAGSNHSCGSAHLGFDPTVSSHFHVFEYGINDDDSLGVNIYSSKTGAWIFKESEWGEDIVVSTYGKGVFVNGCIHMLEFTQIVVIDKDGNGVDSDWVECSDTQNRNPN